MLEHVGHPESAAAIVAAIEKLLAGDGPRTPDLGGTANTAEFGEAIVEVL